MTITGGIIDRIVSLDDIEAVAKKNTTDRARLEARKLAAEALKPETLIDIVVTVSSDEPNLAAMLRSLEKHVSTNFRLLLCFEKNCDTTSSLAKTFQNQMNIEFVKNEGEGLLGALMTGIKYSDSKSILIYSANDFVNAPLIDLMFKKIGEGYDMVIGNRFTDLGSTDGCSSWVAQAERTAANVLHKIAGLPVNDPACQIRMFTNRMIKEIPLESTGTHSFSIEMSLRAAKAGYKIAELPYREVQNGTKEEKQRPKELLSDYLRGAIYAISGAWKN